MNLRRYRVLAGVLALFAGALTVVAPPAAAAPTRYEAESATISQGVVESNHTGFSGTGFVNGDNVAGGYVQWTVNAATARAPPRSPSATPTAPPPTGRRDISVNGTVVAAASAFNGTGELGHLGDEDPDRAGRTPAPTRSGSPPRPRPAPPTSDYLDFEVAAPRASPTTRRRTRRSRRAWWSPTTPASPAPASSTTTTSSAATSSCTVSAASRRAAPAWTIRFANGTTDRPADGHLGQRHGRRGQPVLPRHRRVDHLAGRSPSTPR